MTFIIAIFQLHCKGKHKQANLNKVQGDMCKSDGNLPHLQSSTLFRWHERNERNLFLDKIYLKNEWQEFWRKNVLSLISFRKC